MTDEVQTPQGNSDNSALLKKLTELTQQNEIMKARAAALETQLQASQAASQEAQSKITTLEQQLAQVTAEKDTVTAELETARSSIEELTSKVTEVTDTARTSMEQLKIYKLLSSDPKYHAILDIVDSLSIPSDTEEAKALLDKMADKFKSAQDSGAQAAAEAFKSMGAIPNTGGTPSGQVSGPATADDALKMAMEALDRGDFAAFDELSNKAAQLSAGQQ